MDVGVLWETVLRKRFLLIVFLLLSFDQLGTPRELGSDRPGEHQRGGRETPALVPADEICMGRSGDC